MGPYVKSNAPGDKGRGGEAMASHKRSGKSRDCQSLITPLPLKMLRSEEEEGPVPHSRNEMAMQIEPSTFKLPRDWLVKKVRRTSGKSRGTIDTYYYEPETGQQFRSLRSIQRYLREKMENPSKYNYEPGSSRQYESLKSIQRHLMKESKCWQQPSPISDVSKENNSSRKAKTSMSHFAKPPKKVKWVLSGTGGDEWSPYINSAAVPESLKRTWAKIFMLHVNERC